MKLTTKEAREWAYIRTCWMLTTLEKIGLMRAELAQRQYNLLYKERCAEIDRERWERLCTISKELNS